MKFGAPTNEAELLLAVQAWLTRTPPGLFAENMAPICGPNDKEFDNRERNFSYVEIRANRATDDQGFWAGGGALTQVVAFTLTFSIQFHFDVDHWKAMDAALTDSTQGAWPFIRLFKKHMNEFYFDRQGVSKLLEPVRPLDTQILDRTENMYFKVRQMYACRIREDMET